MRVDTRNIHRFKTPGVMGLGDAQSDAARARRLSFSPALANVPQPSIINLSASGGKVSDKITVTTDYPADGLVFFNPALPNQNVTVDSIDTNVRNAQGGSTIVFKVPGTQTQEFPWLAGTYDLRAWAVANDIYSPNPTPFTVAEYVRPGATPVHPTYIPPGVTANAQGQLSVPGSPVWNGTSVIPPLSSPATSPAPSTSGAGSGSGSGAGSGSGGGNSQPPSSSFAFPSFFTDEAISGIPNWVLMLGAAGALWFFGSKK